LRARHLQKDTTQNIARRYRHLFRLPSSGRAIVYSSVPVFLIALISRYVFFGGLLLAVLSIVLAEVLLFASVWIDTLALRGNPVATFRRLEAITLISNGMWLILSVLGLLVFALTGSTMRYFSLALLGAFFAVDFRAFVFGTVFYRSPLRGLPLAFIQPALISIPVFIIGSNIQSLSATLLVPLAVGFATIAAVELYMRAINGTLKIQGFRPLEMLQAFIGAWVVEDPQNMERMLEMVSSDTNVESEILDLKAGGTFSALLVVPGIHPGPFYPIGSSNLPSDIFNALRDEETVPLTVHSISDHDLNLPSKAQVAGYVSSLKEKRSQSVVDSGNIASLPVLRTVGKATVSGLAFGSTLVIALTQSPHGMEDFPVEVKEGILQHSTKAGFRATLIIDAHNSEGAKPNEKEAKDAVEASRQVIEELQSAQRYTFKLAFAHSSELQDKIKERDVGPAGVGLLYFEIDGKYRFSLVVVDANNSLIGFREKILSSFEKQTGSRLLEICTSDTHVTAAKAKGAKGYLALGDEISSERFSSIVVSLYERARNRIEQGSYSTSIASSNVKTAGGALLHEFSGLLDSTLRVAKVGAAALALVAVASILIVALF